MQIAGNAFLVTGGASGLGEATASRLAKAGGRVVIADVNEEAGRRLALHLGDTARFAKADVTREDDLKLAITAAASFAPSRGLRGIICCAGIAPAAKVFGKKGPHPAQLFRQAIEINLVGTFHAMTLAAAAMAENEPDDDGERGVIINTASVAAFEGQIGQIAYAASKGGVAAMTLPAARDLAPLGIRVVAIAPGVFDTPMVEGMPEKVRQGLEAQCVFPPRLGRAEEYASLVEEIIRNRMLNGAVLRLDGAVRLAAR
ncbi:MAG: SDR family NAD(P)-dependent oxidoreductase [Phycisphaeraceae bacterium]